MTLLYKFQMEAIGYQDTDPEGGIISFFPPSPMGFHGKCFKVFDLDTLKSWIHETAGCVLSSFWFFGL